MNDPGRSILEFLGVVDGERKRRMNDAALDQAVVALKRYQQARFVRTHTDLLAHTRFGPAARFFLDELYGPQDFSLRDAQFGRIVPALVGLFPRDIVCTVVLLAELHALSERLDSAMAAAIGAGTLNREAYVRAWQAVGDAAGRSRQLALVMEVGLALDRHTRSLLLRASLKAMRTPSRAAGLGELQGFLEIGFEAFAAMKGAQDFLDTVALREGALVRRLFEPGAQAAASAPDIDDILRQLP